MNKNQRIRAYLWQDVIRLGFCPPNLHAWIHLFFHSLTTFWEIDRYPDGPKGSDPICCSIDLPNLEIYLKIELNNKGYLHVSYDHFNGFSWIHHSDPQFFTFPFDKCLDYRARSSVIANFENKAISDVLSALIFHPREHQHILISPIKNHKIRIGGGLNNPLLYLFHLRYQLCPIEEKKEAERDRLIKLFSNTIRNDTHLAIKDLMALS